MASSLIYILPDDFISIYINTHIYIYRSTDRKMSIGNFNESGIRFYGLFYYFLKT